MPIITIAVPEKVTSSENGTAQSQPQQSSSEINKLFEANTQFAVWLIFLAFGGGVLALYYARIGYLPEMEWEAALIYLFVGSIVGGVISLLLTLSVLIPGFIWSEFIIFEPGINFTYGGSADKLSSKKPQPELCMRSIVWHLGLPFLGALLASHLALLVGKRLYWLVAIYILEVTFLGIYIRFKGLLKTPQAGRQVFKCSFWFTLSVFLSQVSMYIIYWLSGRPGDLSGGLNWTSWYRDELPIFLVLSLICTAGVWCSNHVVAALYRYRARHAVAAALIAAGLLLFTADRFSSLSVRLMSSFGLGGETKITLLMTPKGAVIVNGLGLTSSSDTVKLSDVEVLSKVGEHYFFSINGKTFTLAKSEVLSIESEDRRRKK